MVYSSREGVKSLSPGFSGKRSGKAGYSERRNEKSF